MNQYQNGQMCGGPLHHPQPVRKASATIYRSQWCGGLTLKSRGKKHHSRLAVIPRISTTGVKQTIPTLRLEQEANLER